MPIYGSAKTRSIIRSILPATNRRTAREKIAAVHRNHRRDINRTLNYYAARSDCPDFFDEIEEDITHYPDRLVRQEMWHRRNFDKVAPMVRWAEKKVRNLPVENRRSDLRKILPDNTIGRHALSHVDHLWDPNFVFDPESGTYSWSSRRRTEDNWRSRLEANLVGVIQRGELAEFNRWMKRHHYKARSSIRTWGRKLDGTSGWIDSWVEGHLVYQRDTRGVTMNYCNVLLPRGYVLYPCDHAPRTLKGEHDIEAFAQDVKESKHREWRKAVEEYFA